MNSKKDELLLSSIRRVSELLYPKGQQEENIAKLCQAYNAPSMILETPASELKETYHLPSTLAFFYSMMPQVSRYILAERVSQNKTITSIRSARAHLLSLYLGLANECGYMLCLTKQGKLLKTVNLSEGSINETPFYNRVIVEAALESKGECFILAHNHPGGTPSASGADCHATLRAMFTMSELGLILIDHIILADVDAYSIRETGSIDPKYWQMLSPLPPEFENWL